jgi:hypothetical protein
MMGLGDLLVGLGELTSVVLGALFLLSGSVVAVDVVDVVTVVIEL